MKKYKILFLLLVGFVFTFNSCKNDDFVVFPSSEYFVALNAPSLVLPEGDTVVISIYAAAQPGEAITINFTASDNASRHPMVEGVDYEILTMNNQPMTTKSLVLPDGMSPVSFKLAVMDDELVNPGRKITISLTSNSANYALGMENGQKGATLVFDIKDDEVIIGIDELVGSWTLDERYVASGGVFATRKIPVTVEKIDATTISFTGLGGGGANPRTVIATVDLGAKVKYAYIATQQVFPGLNPAHDTWFTYSAYMFSDEPIWGDVPVLIDKDADDVITMYFDPGGNNLYGYAFYATTIGTQNFLGYYGNWLGGIPGTMTK